VGKAVGWIQTQDARIRDSGRRVRRRDQIIKNPLEYVIQQTTDPSVHYLLNYCIQQ
jgi:hypothetical protein